MRLICCCKLLQFNYVEKLQVRTLGSRYRYSTSNETLLSDSLLEQNPIKRPGEYTDKETPLYQIWDPCVLNQLWKPLATALISRKLSNLDEIINTDICDTLNIAS